MFRAGWAAFLASVASLILFGTAPGAAQGARPIYACFSPQNAAIIGRLGANDPSVRYGFESGECLALPPGVPLSDVERQGSLWRFRVFGARPYLYAADWAAGFQPASGPSPAGFEQYLPVTARLMSNGRTYAECYDAAAKLSERFRDFDRRWRDYQTWGRSKPDQSTQKVVIYVGDQGPKLSAEYQQLRAQAAALDQRCASYYAMDADDDFVAFVRTAQYA